MTMAASSTLMVCGPRCATVPNGDSGQAGTRPKLGFKPKVPHSAAGLRIEPAPSVPMAIGAMPAATAAAAPPEEPPVVLAAFQGLRVRPVSGELVSHLQPNSGVAVLPTITAPAARSRAATGASTSQGWSAAMVALPRRVGMPWVRIRSLIDTGTPSSGPMGVPCCQRWVLARAAWAAPSGSRWQKALSVPSTRSMRPNTALATSSGEAWPVR